MNILNEDFVEYNKNISLGVNIYDLISSVRKGITYSEFERLSTNLPFSLLEWSDFLHITSRTMSRYKLENKPFDLPQSERIMQISMFYKKGLKLFEDKEYFNVWLNSTNLALGKITPKSLLDSSFGIELLSQELIKIEHGVLA